MSQLTLALFIASAVRLTVPILLAAFGELVSERAGIFNVGIEGMMLFGAFSAVAGAGWTSSAPGGLAVGAAFGCLSGLVLGFFVVVLRADQVVAGIGLNILALGVTSFLREQYVNSPGRQTAMLYRRPGGTEWESLDLETATDMIADRIVETRARTWQEQDHEGRFVNRTLALAGLGGATLDNEENYLIKKLFTAMGAVQIENQARI